MGGEEGREGIGGGRATHHFSPPLYCRQSTTRMPNENISILFFYHLGVSTKYIICETVNMPAVYIVRG